MNELYYGIPFYSNSLSFQSPCNCNKNSTNVRLFKKANYTKNCEDKNDESEIAKSLINLNITSVLICSNCTTISSHKNNIKYLNKDKKQTFLRKYVILKIKEYNDVIKQKYFQLTKKKQEKSCECEKDEVRLSLFCEKECKSYTEYLNKINEFYDNALHNVDKIFENSSLNTFLK